MPVSEPPLPPSGSYAIPSEISHGAEDAPAEALAVGTAVTVATGVGVVELLWPHAAKASATTAIATAAIRGRVRLE